MHLLIYTHKSADQIDVIALIQSFYRVIATDKNNNNFTVNFQYYSCVFFIVCYILNEFVCAAFIY